MSKRKLTESSIGAGKRTHIWRIVKARPELADAVDQPFYGCETDPRHPKDDKGWYEYYVCPNFEQRSSLIEHVHSYDIWEDPLWREFISIYVPCKGNRPTDDEFAEFRGEMEDGDWDDEWHEFNHGEVSEVSQEEYLALRLLYAFLLKHRVDMMETLIDLDYAHVGCQLFPRNRRFENGKNYKVYSLLGIALFESQNVDAVRMLLERGADPRDCHAHSDGSRFMHAPDVHDCYDGAELVIWYDRFNGFEADGVANEMLVALFEYGADWVNASFWTDRADNTDEEMKSIVSSACAAQSARNLQRWHNVLAIVQLIAFWRRAAAAPDSKAALRAAKRFRGEASY